MLERETKLLVDGEFRVPPLDVLAGVQIASEDDVELSAVYYDSPDLRLTRAGASLRYRSDDGWTVKLPRPSDHPSRLTRSEHVFAGGPDAPPNAAVDLVRAWIRNASVREVARVLTRRHRIVLIDEHGARVAEIDDDRVVATAPSRPRSSFREVEIELAEHVPEPVAARVTACVRKSGRTRPSRVPKVARALGVAPAERARDAVLARDASTREFVATVIDRSVHRLVEHDPIVRLGQDPEGVHQARVATRRLRADLRTFRRALDRSWSEPLREELRWLGRELGRVRDADVLHDLLCAQASWLPADAQSALDEIVQQSDDRRRRHREDLLRTMRSSRYARLLDRLVEASRTPVVRHDVASDPVRRRAPRWARRPWRRLHRSIDALGDAPDDAALHEERRRAKQARYAVEALAVLEDDWPDDIAARAEDVQQLLGDHQDRVVARSVLERTAEDRPALAFVAGLIAGRLACEQDDLRKRARRATRRARKQPRSRIRL